MAEQPSQANQPGHPGPPGHPDPGPSPDPGPPQPIPPPEPVPPPEPPKATELPTATQIEFPPLGAYPGEPGHPDERPGEPTRQLPRPTGEQPWQVPAAPPPKQRRTTLWVSVAAAVALVLCGGGGVSAYLLLRNAEKGTGAPDPATAVTRFLTAVYTDRDAAAANNLVCSEARDTKQVSAKVDEVKAYDNQYTQPRFGWADPSIATETEDRAVVSVALTMTTQDEKTAAQDLTFTVVKKTGWWVCEVAG